MPAYPRLPGRSRFLQLCCDVARVPRVYNCPVQVLISAGEALGEMYGAQLIEALDRAVMETKILGIHTDVGEGARATLKPEFFGAGGERMRAAGCEIIVDAKDLAVVGITEILSHLPKILGLYWQLIRRGR